MASLWFLKLAFKCVDHFAWPLLALGYPLCASVQAIETDSYTETRNLISYWILFSLIYLFEYAFMGLLQWFQFWPYIKLMIIFWLIIPDFGRASHIYNNLICSCISMNPQTVISRLNNYWRKFFVKKENFLLLAEGYIRENGTEALEKLIAGKNTMYKPDAEATNAIRAIDNKEMQQNTMYKPDAEATNAVRATDNKEMQQTNREGLQTEHKDIKDLEVIEKKEIPAGKQNTMNKPDAEATNAVRATDNKEMQQDIPVMPNSAPSQKASSTMLETKGIAGKDTAGGELPQSSSTRKEVQKEWTCALCQVTTTCEKNLNSHLHGSKHRAKCEALKVKNQPTLMRVDFQQQAKIFQSKEESKQKNIINQLKNGESIVNNGLKGKVVVGHKVQEPQKNLSKPVRMNNSKLKCKVCNVTLYSEVNLASHLNGRKHLTRIKEN